MKTMICSLIVTAWLVAPWIALAESPAASAPELVGNKLCPVSGNPVGGSPDNPFFFSDFKGYRVGFMCPVCKAKFDKADDAGKTELLNKALASVGKPPVK